MNLCRFLLGGVFVFSGFVKAIDPFGSYYKLQDYLTAFGMGGWIHSALLFLAGILLAAVEFCVGVYMFLGIRKTVSAGGALLLMLFMTPLTLYLALANPVADCGCFGDALTLTNWETFGKNVVLLVCALSAFRWRKDIIRFITRKTEWVFSMYAILFVFALSFYCLYNLPVIDFRPYKIGVNIRESMKIPEGAPQKKSETFVVVEKDGVKKEIPVDDYANYEGWTFVETREVIKEEGYIPPIQDFWMWEKETGDDITDKVLSDKGYTFLLVSPRIEEADDSNIDLINEIYDYSMEHGYGFYALTASGEEAILQWSDRTGAEYPFCETDEITLKTIIRSNPGLLLIKDGTILNKWSDSNLPDEYVLADKLENISVGQQKVVSLDHTLGQVLLWFAVPLCLVLVVDILIIKRREKHCRLAEKKNPIKNGINPLK